MKIINQKNIVWNAVKQTAITTSRAITFVMIAFAVITLILNFTQPNNVRAAEKVIDPFANVRTVGAGEGTNNPTTVNLSGVVNNQNTPAQTNSGSGPTKSTGYQGLVRCDGVKDPNNASSRVCDFMALIDTANYLISWIIYIAVTIALGLFIYAGFLYVTGVPKNIEKAHSVFKSVVLGLVFMLLSWFIVSTILDWLQVKDPEFTSLIGK